MKMLADVTRSKHYMPIGKCLLMRSREAKFTSTVVKV
jgi:hypothetical protein